VLDNYIGGKWVKPANGEYLDDVNPATNQVIAKIPRSGSEDIDAAAKAAKEAFKTWGKTSFEERAVYLEKLAAAIERRLEAFAALESADTGKPLKLAQTLDIPRACSNLRFFAGAIRHDFVEAHHMHDALNYSFRTPIGVAGLITPWNLPLYLLTWKVAPALAMGNTIVMKPSEVTPLTAHALVEMCDEIGLPAGVVNLVSGYGATAGSALVAHPDIHLVSFTGGTVTGRHVAATAASMFKKLSLELGGKNATVVFADADFDAALTGAFRASFSNQGQICLCGSRVFVEESLYDKFVKALVEKTKTELKCGDPKTSNFGSLSSHVHREKIEYYVKLAREEGGEILCGGKRPDSLPAPFNEGAFYEPTIIAGLPPSSRVSREEIFGPVITIHPFRSEEEVVREINSTTYGLAGSVWTTNLQRAHRVSRAWETGMVWVNCWLHRDLRVPFGGVKESGVGREGGRHSLEFYSDIKNICVHHGPSPY